MDYKPLRFKATRSFTIPDGCIWKDPGTARKYVESGSEVALVPVAELLVDPKTKFNNDNLNNMPIGHSEWVWVTVPEESLHGYWVSNEGLPKLYKFLLTMCEPPPPPPPEPKKTRFERLAEEL